MPIFGGEKCPICGKTGKREASVFDPATRQYYCCEEHKVKAAQLRSLSEKARQKGMILCTNCLKEIRPNAYSCRHCGSRRVSIPEYKIGGMCPFTVVQIGSTKYGQGDYIWRHSECIQDYCALWDIKQDKCSLMLRP
jgi:hypothetical protein